MKSPKYLALGFLLAVSMFAIIGATNVRDVGNSDNGRYDFWIECGLNSEVHV